jgi:hypothetical protein
MIFIMGCFAAVIIVAMVILTIELLQEPVIEPAQVTATYGAWQFHLQLTALAGTPIP